MNWLKVELIFAVATKSGEQLILEINRILK